ncbi:hypothetical protein [Algibacter mikhailovii]|uniref:hypothetical protein n=1 Tax=Algibacter mikhailovii TaxID=425498 RepID=UPI0024958076|nr:hypothetical protein [Algibacter mikhailovii]
MKNLKIFKSIGMYLCLATICLSCSNDDVKSSNETSFYKPSGVIAQERAIELSNSWSSKNADLFSKSGSTKFDDEVKSLGWSLEDLRNYLDYAEHEAQEKGYNMTGVRIYFAAYPEKDNQNTMFIAPTGHKVFSTASMFNLFQPEEQALPIPPLNNGNGGGGYP